MVGAGFSHRRRKGFYFFKQIYIFFAAKIHLVSRFSIWAVFFFPPEIRSFNTLPQNAPETVKPHTCWVATSKVWTPPCLDLGDFVSKMFGAPGRRPRAVITSLLGESGVSWHWGGWLGTNVPKIWRVFWPGILWSTKIQDMELFKYYMYIHILCICVYILYILYIIYYYIYYADIHVNIFPNTW